MYFLINGHEHINVYPRIPEMLDKDPSTKRVRVILRIRLNDLTFFANPVSSKNLIYLLPSCAPLYMQRVSVSLLAKRLRSLLRTEAAGGIKEDEDKERRGPDQKTSRGTVQWPLVLFPPARRALQQRPPAPCPIFDVISAVKV